MKTVFKLLTFPIRVPSKEQIWRLPDEVVPATEIILAWDTLHRGCVCLMEAPNVARLQLARRFHRLPAHWLEAPLTFCPVLE